MESPNGYRMNCPKCGRTLQHVVKLGVSHLLNCADHGLVVLPPDGTLYLQSERTSVASKEPNEKDITAEVKAALPKDLAAKLQESEKALGKSVCFLEIESLGGASGGLDPSGKIYLTTAVNKDMAVVGEEIMHLHWRTSGRPRMLPLQPAKEEGYGSAILQIGGHFEEYSFFPFLEGLKLNPRSVVNATMNKTARLLKNEIPEVKDAGETDYWRVFLAALFSQANLMTNERAGAPVLAVFQDAALAPYAKVGQLVCDEIVAAQRLDKAGIKKCMERTLFQHLGLNADAVEVKTDH